MTMHPLYRSMGSFISVWAEKVQMDVFHGEVSSLYPCGMEDVANAAVMKQLGF